MKYINNTEFNYEPESKVAVLLVNLGTPDEPTTKAVRVYLKEFLSDPRIVELPRALWWCILNGIILPFRSKRSAENYASIWSDQGSPLFVNTQKLTEKLQQKESSTGVNVDFAMRYGNASVESKMEALIQQGFNKVLVIPLYPQYSATTTASTFDAIASCFTKRRWFPELRFVNQYYTQPKYVESLVRKIQSHWQNVGRAEKLILSFHGIPKRFWKKGDPYVDQCLHTGEMIREALGLSKDEILTTFQSRFGKDEWIKPYTDVTLKDLAKSGVKSVQLICPGFAVDCLETLEEIKEENREYFIESGGKDFQYISCLNDDDDQVQLLSDLIHSQTQGWKY